MGQNRYNQTDIARLAEVSLATVDRVLNNRPGVASRTAKRIQAAIDTLESGKTVMADSLQRLQLDFILPSGPNTFIGNLADAAEQAGQQLDGAYISTRVHRIESFNAAALADAIRQIAKNSDGLAVMALENPAVREAVHDVIDAGTPVVTIVSNLSTLRKTGYIGINNQAAGRTAAYLMSRFAPKKQGRIALVEGSIDLAYLDHQEREFGFRDALREYAPGLDIIGRLETRDDPDIARQEIVNLLDAEPELVGVYNIGGGTRGIIQGLKEAGRDQDLVCLAHDLTRFTREFLLDGSLDAIIHQDACEEALSAARLLRDWHLNNGRVDIPDHCKTHIYFRENLP